MSNLLQASAVLQRSGCAILVHLTIGNKGGAPARHVVLTNAAVGGITAIPLPQVLGALAPGASTLVTLTVPAALGTGDITSLSVSGTWIGGVFTHATRISLPQPPAHTHLPAPAAPDPIR